MPTDGREEKAGASQCRKLRKKLAEIASLQRKIDDGIVEPDDEQLEKLGRKAEFEAALRELEAASIDDASILVAPELPAKAMAPPAAKPEAKPGTPAQPEKSGMQGGGSLDSTEDGFEPDKSRSPPLKATRGFVARSFSNMSAGFTEHAQILKSPSMRWQEDPAAVEDVMPTPKPPKEPEIETIENVQPFSAAVQSSERMRTLVQSVSELSMMAFDEDALSMVTRKARWKLTLLALPDGSGFSLDEEPVPELIGFIVYRLRPELQSLSIAKLAIVPEHRRMGHGCRLIEWCVRCARKQPSISFIALSSLPEAVKFYQRLGFKKFDVKWRQDKEPDEDFVEGQVYMEKPIRKGGRGKKR